MSQRSLLLVITGIVMGAIIATVAVKVADDDADLATGRSSPLPTPTATLAPDVTPEVPPTPAPGTTPGPTQAPAPNAPAGNRTSERASITVTGTRTTTTTTTTTSSPSRPAPPRPANINCSETWQFCSSETYSMTVKDGKLEGIASSQSVQEPGGPRFPTFNMGSQVLQPNGAPAGKGDPVQKVKVSAKIENKTSKTFIFPEGDVSLKMTRDGTELKTPKAQNGYYEMEPGLSMTAEFEVSTTQNGNYSWRAVTWFYEK